MVRAAGEQRFDTAPQVMRRARVPGSIVDRQQEPGPEDKVDLDRHQSFVPVVEVEQDEVDQPGRDLDLRSLVALEHILDDQLMEPQSRPDPFHLPW